MSKVFIVLVLTNSLLFAKGTPLPAQSVYGTIKTELEKCPYLKETLLQTEPDFLKPCTNFGDIKSIKSVEIHNLEEVLCTIYYNDILVLCYLGNLTHEEVLHYFSKDAMKTALENSTQTSVCETFKTDTHVVETVIEPMKVILKKLEYEQCRRICSDFDGRLFPVCNEAAYMINVFANINATRAANVNKTVASALDQTETATHQLIPTVNISDNSIKAADKSLNKVQPSEAVRKLDTTSINKTISSSEQELPQIVPPGTQKTVPHQDTASVQTKTQNTDVDQLPKAKDINGTVVAEPKDKAVTSQQTSVPKPTKSSGDNQGKVEKPPSDTALETDNDKLSGITIDDGAKSEDYEEPEEDDTQTEDIKNRENTKLTEIKKPEIIKASENTKQIEIKKPEGIKEPENKEMEIKKSDVKHKTPKPEETIDDDISRPASYNQQLDEDDSYFFSYFMMICGVFILAYVGYHNKQKVFALVLEGRRGRRTSRSRRPNSANYHKLDSNLEEAVTSSCNKNTTNIIY